MHHTRDRTESKTEAGSKAGGARTEGLLLRSKVLTPPVADHHVSRPRVRALLDEQHHARLTVVVSPAGYGKSALLAEWANGSPNLVSWLRLDEGDSDPAVFIRYLVASVGAVAPEAARHATDLASDGASPRVIATALMASIASSAPVVTILDDFHRVSGTDVTELCSHVLDELPPSWRWIIGSRSEPPLGLARMRANLSLGMISADQLRFDDQEAHRLLVEGMEIDAMPDVTSTVNQRATGWVAGLCLAGLAAQESPVDQEGALLRYSGQDRYLAAYFAEEVLAQIPPQLQDFVLDTSVLHVLSPDVCRAVIDAEDATLLLNEIARRRFFITRIGRDRPDVYEYHDLFSSWLQAELEARKPGRSAILRRRAAAWCRDRGLVAEAVRYSLDAGDWSTAAELIVEHGYGFIQHGIFRTVLTWITALPEAELERVPALAVLAGDAAANSGEWPQVVRFTEVALGADTSTVAGKAVRLGGLILNWFTLLAGGTVEEMEACSAEMEHLAGFTAAVTPRHEGEDPGRAFGLAAVTQYILADYPRALELVRRAEQGPGTLFAALVPEGIEALVRFAMGEIAEAEHLARDSLSQADRVDELPIGAILGALVLLWTGDDSDVAASCAIVNRVAERARLAQGPVFVALCIAEAANRAGDHRRAAQAVEEARRQMDELQEPRFVQKLVEIQAERVHGPDGAPDWKEMSDRERDVLRLLLTDLTRSEIARELGISPETVKTHTARIYRKLGASGRAEAVQRARRFGLV